MAKRLGPEGRPLLRGWIHLASAVAAPFLLAYLLWEADSPRDYAGVSVFGSGLLALFSVSAAYHLGPWKPGVRQIIGRVDHSTIFVAIAAFYTPFCLLALDLAWGAPLLVVTWTLCLAGAALKLSWVRLPRPVSVASYLAVGWLAAVSLPVLEDRLSTGALGALLAAGALYSLGALAYAARWPNPFPRVFAHHEVFHTLVSAASLVLYGVVATELLRG